MNAVMKRMESGKMTVKGLRMMYPVTDGTLFKVVVKGISFSDSSGNFRCSDGPRVIVEPVDGVGDFAVEVKKLVDDNEASRRVYFARHKATLWRRENRSDSHGVLGLKRQANQLIAELKEPQRKRAFEIVSMTPSENWTAPAKANQYELSRLIDGLLQVKFGFDDPEEKD